MKPVGLTMKKGRNKYRLESGGELMLIHQCVQCGTLSINRIAADDHPDSVMDVFHQSRALSRPLRSECESQGIFLLEDAEIIHLQLYGTQIEIPVPEWN
jgi:hypothetical protein